jgi:threonyl-tRNA synthetase
VDYNLPERFDLTYTGSDNQKHRPVMIHRAPFGSLERFTGVLIEHFRGAFPVWLAPEQARFLPVNDQMVAYAEKCAEEFRAAGLRVSVDKKGDKLGGQIRRGQLEKVPFLLVCGNREAEAGQVAVRSREKGDEGAQALGLVKDRMVDLMKRRVSLP